MSLLDGASLNRRGITIDGTAASVGALVAVSTVGGGVSTGYALLPAPRTATGNRVVADGDSTTLGNVNSAAAIQSMTYSWPLYAQLHSGGRINIVRVAAVGGTTIAQILARFDVGVAPYAPTTVVLTAGTNDVFAGTLFTDWTAGIQAYHAKCRAIGARLVLGTLVPNNTAGNKPVITKMNAWLTRYAQLNGLSIIDFYSVLVDPTAGGYIAAANSTDGIHPAESGYQLMGQVAANVLAPTLPAWAPPLVKSQNDTTNLMCASTNNCLFITDTNADGVPDGWTASGSATGVVHSLVTDTAVPGKMLRIAIDSTASGARIVTKSLFPPGSFTVGDRLAVCGVATTSGTNIRARVKAQFNSTGGQSLMAAEFCGAVTRGVFYQEAVVPAGCSQVDISVQAEPGATVGSATADFGQITVHNLTALGLA